LLSFFGNILLRQLHDLSNILDESTRTGDLIVADQKSVASLREWTESSEYAVEDELKNPAEISGLNPATF
jgi:uncharacterized protein (DUF1330 family)